MAMAVISKNQSNTSSSDDPLLPWLWSIEKVLKERITIDGRDLHELCSNCISTFKNNPRYQNEMDSSSDHERIYREIEQKKICLFNSLLYETYALFLEAKGRLIDAFLIYHLGISRNAEPLGRLKKAQVLFLERMSEKVTAGSLQKMDIVSENGGACVNPWLISTIKSLLQKKNPEILKYDGYHPSKRPYSGKVSLSTLQKSARNKTIDIDHGKVGTQLGTCLGARQLLKCPEVTTEDKGGYSYQIKGCAGQGGFAQVFKVCCDGNPDEVVALKIQKPAFPWEFYIYRQLDMRIPEKERLSFGYAHRLHLYSDYSILVSDFLANGTLQDAINSNVVLGGAMEEVLCIYYTIEMLCILETLHDAQIIHGDFKPDNLLIRYARDDLAEDLETFRHRTGPWREQGLSLVDWGRGIDLSLFPDQTEFIGDSRTSGFRCIQMQEKKPWKYQVDAYGLCVIVHMMLHNSYMEIERRPSPHGGHNYQPKLPFKRYWKVELWKNLFTKLLNIDRTEDHKNMLKSLRESFQDYMCSNPPLIKKLRQLLAKQKTSLCSS